MDEAILNRITADPEIFGGKPIIRGMRISVELILSLLAQGESMEAILDDYPELEPADIRACRPGLITWAGKIALTRTPRPLHSVLSSRVICATAPIAML